MALLHSQQPTSPSHAATVDKMLLYTALSEFDSGHNDACGPCATCTVGRVNHLLPDNEYNGATIAQIRQRDIDHGRFTPGSGQTLDDVHWDIVTFSHHQEVSAYVPYAENRANWDAVHTVLKAESGEHAIVLQLLLAGVLPGNESGIRVHFITISGIDSTLGYFVLNGDDVAALGPSGKGRYPGRWCTADQIYAAYPSGLISVKRDPNQPWV